MRLSRPMAGWHHYFKTFFGTLNELVEQAKIHMIYDFRNIV